MRNLALVLVSLAVLTGCSQPETTNNDAGNTTQSPVPQTAIAPAAGAMEVKAQPAAISAKGVAESVTVDISHGGQPVTKATVTAKSSMPSMNMQGPELTATENAPGKYVMTGDFMKGPWQLDLSVTMPDGTKHPQTVTFEVQ